MNEVEQFDFRGHEVRVIQGDDGEPRWVAADVAKVLGYRDATQVTRFVRDRHKGTEKLCTPGGDQRMTVLTEAGLYAAIMKSRAPLAADFQDWVTDEVLPAIRRHGGYLTPAAAEQALMDPDFIIRLATDLKTERAKREELEAARAVDAPKVVFADAVAVSKTNILVGELAKILRGNGIDIGQNRMFAVLRANGFLINRKGTDWNMPTQRAMDLGLFRIKETTVTHADGHTTISKTPKVTGKGQQYFIERFLDGRLPGKEVA
ncbi:MAG: phage antirepressor Ant [Microbacterium sp.]|uniref:phage antirepressor n=1 Tax=Microbacterium sp. TaxID=51671 RepID=UPI000DB009A4|nr:phage antirepressor KilAC domain-containing protein [Microbacterium sp.]PZU36204.1 MAG: phage antirepressor Ant [Microbacterium sp.]